MATREVRLTVDDSFTKETAQKLFDSAVQNANYRRAYQSQRNEELAELRELKASGKLDKLLAESKTA